MITSGSWARLMTGTGGQERGQEPDIPLSRVHFTNLKKILYPVVM